MTEPIKAIIHYSGEVIGLSPEAWQALAEQMEALSGEVETVTVEGVWHVGVLYADGDVIVLERAVYDSLINALLKASQESGVQNG